MKEVILCYQGEMALKGLNKATFEAALAKALRFRVRELGKFQVYKAQSTMYVEPRDEEAAANFDEAFKRVSQVFGLAALSRAAVCEKDFEAIKATAESYLGETLRGLRTFKVEAKRSDKAFPYTSPEISAEVGAKLLEEFPHLRVNVHEPDIIVRVEIRDFGAYIHGQPIPGAGGIPVGTGGKAAILISGGIDSPVAAWCMAKRGLELTPVHFASPPYTSERAEQKVKDLLQKVSAYAGRMFMFTVPFAKVQEAILQNCPEEYFTIIMRRFMMRVAERIAVREKCGALITGESLGQVASQTLQAIACTDAAASMPVFRPLIGMDKSEIVKIARDIDTFDISIQPFEDCCTVFTPRHPRTRPELSMVLEAEAVLDAESLIRECVENVSITRIAP